MLILASSSPRRQLLLKKITSDFIIIKPDIDERAIDPFMPPSSLSYEESRLKAYAIFASHPNDEILSCDTIVILNGKALEKPADRDDAIRMLKEESGKEQIVLSSYTYLSKDKEISRTVKTRLWFNNLSEEEIIEYVDTYKPLDKAGAYGIQDEAGLIKKIEGSYDNVMGLPTEDIAKVVFGIELLK